jgi:ABC-type glycerol-3-phosphate transport system substrate-binding protein
MILSAFLARTNVDMVMIHGTEQAYEMADFYEVLNPYMTAEDMASLSTSALVGSSPNGDYKTNLRALPLTIQGVGIYYNKTLLANAGFDISKSPANWANFTAACESLKNAGITPIIFGNSGGETSLGYMYSIILQTLLGPRLENLRDGTVNFRSLEFRKATLMIQEMYDTRMDKS